MQTERTPPLPWLPCSGQDCRGFGASEAAHKVPDLPATPFRSARSPCAPPSQSAPAACGCEHSTPCRASMAASGGRCRGGLPVTNAAGTVTTIAACGLMGLHGLTGQCHVARQGRSGQLVAWCFLLGTWPETCCTMVDPSDWHPLDMDTTCQTCIQLQAPKGGSCQMGEG